MDEYIEREEAKEAVKFVPWCDWKAVGNCLDELHAADVVPVVRCKDCKYFHNLTCKIRKGSWGEQLKVGFTDFCSDGDRRDSDG